MTDDEILGLIKQSLLTTDPDRSGHYEKLQPGWSIEDLGCDSVATLNMVTELERRTRVEIPDEDLLTLRDVGDIVALVRRLQEASP